MLEENIQRLFREYFPNQGKYYRGVDRLFQNQKVKQFNVSMQVFHDVFRAMVFRLGKEMPNASYQEFKTTFDRRTTIFVEKFRKNLIHASWALEFAPKKEFLNTFRDVEFILDELVNWRRGSSFKIGKFKFTPTTFVHPETPFCYSITTREGIFPTPVATIGFTLHKENGTVTMRLTTTQGVSGAQKHILSLGKELGGQWRVKLIKRAQQLATRRGWKFEAREPFSFVDGLHQTQEEWESARVRVKRSYRKAHLKQGPRRHIWHPK